ncbi:MAG: hypothetical protein JNM76_13675 [Betaproteobacteria bacterium]|nr:hypothetical protein [Betaproteobacteria bacterium]
MLTALVLAATLCFIIGTGQGRREALARTVYWLGANIRSSACASPCFL